MIERDDFDLGPAEIDAQAEAVVSHPGAHVGVGSTARAYFSSAHFLHSLGPSRAESAEARCRLDTAMTIDPPPAIVPSRNRGPLPPETPTTAGIKATDSVLAFRQAVLDKLTYMVGKEPGHARDHDWLVATALAARDHIVDRWIEATRRTYRDGRKRVYYFSLEFLIGRLLFDALATLASPRPRARRCASSASISTACARSSPMPRWATAASAGSPRASWRAWRRSAIPAHGYGIRYDHGIFRQVAARRLAARVARGMAVVRQSVGVRAARSRRTRSASAAPSRTIESDDGTTRYRWHPAESVDAVAFDTPIAGLARPARQHAAAVVRARGGSAARSTTSTAAITSARSPTACASKRSRACSIPSDETAAGPGAAAAAGILLRLGVAAGPRCAGTSSSTASSRRWPTTWRSS